MSERSQLRWSAPRRTAFICLACIAAVVPSCGTDPDTPTPTPRPKDAIDDVAVSATVSVSGLLQPVRTVRDVNGMVHIYAQNQTDAFFAEGYLSARDRGAQLELLRRKAEGRVAELFGKLDKGQASGDLFVRAIGFRRVAEQIWNSMDDKDPVKQNVSAYAAGVTAYFREIRAGGGDFPAAWSAIPRSKYLDWDGPASYAIGRILSFSLSYTANDEVDVTTLLDALQTTFTADSTDPAKKARANMFLDVLRFEPAMKVPVLPGGVPPESGAFKLPHRPLSRTPLPPDLIDRAKPALEAGRALLGRDHWSSNNWVVGPSKTDSGKVMVASDPHLPLPAAAVFWMNALHVSSSDPAQNMDVAGMSFAGTPGIVLGFNQNIAWGATVAVFDVNDVYRDTISATNTVPMKQPDGTMKDVPIQTVTEMFDYGDGIPKPVTFELVPGHGVILPEIKDSVWQPRSSPNVLSYRWTGMEPTNEIKAFYQLDRAKSVDDAIAAYAPFQVGAQNIVIGDSQGNIGYTTHAWVPTRPDTSKAWDATKYKGQLPCFVQPGDAGMEWNGRLGDNVLPHAKNLAAGYIATANSDQYGLVFDNDPSNDPIYLSCLWDMGFRRARVGERIDAIGKLTPSDMASAQADAKSPFGSHIAPFFAAAIRRAEAARTGKTPAPDLTAVLADPRYDPAQMQYVAQLLEGWKDLGYDTASGAEVAGDPTPSDAEIRASQATLIFNASVVPLYKYAFDDEIKAMGSPPWMKDLQTKGLMRMLEKPTPLAAADASGESILWDDMTTPSVAESRDDRLMRALLDGVTFVTTTLGKDPNGWRWGLLHTIRFGSILPTTEAKLSIPIVGDKRWPAGGFPRHGDDQCIDRADFGQGGSDYSMSFGYSDGPAQRMVAVLDPSGPIVRNALPGGNVWRQDSPHFDDDAQLWRLNKTHPVMFSPGDVKTVAESRTDLLPQ